MMSAAHHIPSQKAATTQYLRAPEDQSSDCQGLLECRRKKTPDAMTKNCTKPGIPRCQQKTRTKTFLALVSLKEVGQQDKKELKKLQLDPLKLIDITSNTVVVLFINFIYF